MLVFNLPLIICSLVVRYLFHSDNFSFSVFSINSVVKSKSGFKSQNSIISGFYISGFFFLCVYSIAQGFFFSFLLKIYSNDEMWVFSCFDLCCNYKLFIICIYFPSSVLSTDNSYTLILWVFCLEYFVQTIYACWFLFLLCLSDYYMVWVVYFYKVIYV